MALRQARTKEGGRFSIEQEQPVYNLRKRVIYLTDSAVRQRIEWVGEAMFWIDEISEHHDDEWLQIVYRLVNYGRESIGAMLRQEPLPERSEQIQQYARIIEQGKWEQERLAEEQAEWLAIPPASPPPDTR